jgi:hypothetical protein
VARRRANQVLGCSQRGSWYARWRIGPRQVERKVGAKRSAWHPRGLTKPQAEERVAAALKEHCKRSETPVPTISSSAIPRPADRSTHQDEEALQGRDRGGRGPLDLLSRPPRHLEHEDSRGRGAAADHPGMDGPPRPQDDRNLRRLRARSGPGCTLGRGSLRREGRVTDGDAAAPAGRLRERLIKALRMEGWRGCQRNVASLAVISAAAPGFHAPDTPSPGSDGARMAGSGDTQVTRDGQ